MMVMLTYRMPNEIQEVAKQGEFDEFVLNVFFEKKANVQMPDSNMRTRYRNG